VRISRTNFAEEFMPALESLNLRKTLYVNFEGEMGIDYGGVKREFYDLIGKFMKDSRYKLLAPIFDKNEGFYFHPEINKVSDNLCYISLFGKLAAHTIMLGEILGIEFALPLIKLLYN
jgi:hypothetical protein